MRSVLRRIFVLMDVRHSFGTRAVATVLFFVLPAFCIVLSERANAQQLDSLACARPVAIDSVPGVFFGGSLIDTVRLVNTFTDPADSVFTLSISDTTNFKVSIDTFHVHRYNTYQLALTYRPSDTERHAATLTIVATASKCIDTIQLTAPLLRPTADSALFGLDLPIPPVIAIQSNSNTKDIGVRFKNFGPNPVIIDSLYVIGIDSLFITSAPRYPDTIPQDGIISLTLSLWEVQPGFQQGYLIASSGHSIITEECIIEVQRLATSIVFLPLVTSRYVQVFPNPSYAGITLRANSLTQSRVTVTDLLGRTIVQSSFNRDWQWDRERIAGGIAPAGTYFLIVSGTTASGDPIREVQTIVLE